MKLPRIKFSKEYYLILLPLFFVLHGYVENRVSIHLIDAWWLFFKYALISIILVLFFFLYMKDFRKAALISFILVFINFFMGSFHEFLKKELGIVWLTRYSVFISLLLILFIVAIIVIKKASHHHTVLVRYLNLLFIILCLWEVVQFMQKSVAQKAWEKQYLTKGLRPCKTCVKPDIYLIMADEYAGDKELRDEFGFNNVEFLNALRSRGFYVVQDPVSNYNQTAYSVASMFRMDYLDNIEKDGTSKKDINYCYNIINKNSVIDFLKNAGYDIKNLSIFPFDNQHTPLKQAFLFTGTNLITHETFISKMESDIGFNLVTKYRFKPAIDKMNEAYFTNQKNNEKLLADLSAEVKNKTDRPRFVYAHLSMPHYPFYFNKDGQPYPVVVDLPDSATVLKPRYVEYLQYCNKKFLGVIDNIQKQSSRPYIILFMSDHGARLVTTARKEYHFMTINAVYFPNRKYDGFYPGMSNVNQFRVMLNSIFQQNLALVKDSTIFFE